MIRFKTFMVVYLLAVVTVSIFTIVILSRLSENRYIMTSLTVNHFSVRWMGFAPTDYSNQYPDYCICINNLKDDPLTMKIALRIKNQETNGYYFLIDQYATPPANWTINQYTIGYVAADATLDFIYSNPSRSKPTTIPEGILTESIELVVKAYYDSAYTSFYSQDNFTVTFQLIDRLSPVWGQLCYDDFEDGTTQQWAKTGSASWAALSTTYYRSFQHSFQLKETSVYYSYHVGYTKAFNISSCYNSSFLTFSIRSARWDDPKIDVNGTTYFKPDETLSTDTWYQFTVPIPAGIVQVAIWVAWDLDSAYLDDVYLIAK
jgi:hypothetical protein